MPYHIKFLSLLFFSGLVHVTGFGQVPRFTLFDPHPGAGKKIQVSYQNFELKAPALKILVYYLDNQTYPAEEVTLKRRKRGFFNGEVKLPDAARAFLVRVVAEKNNADNGYIFLVYQDNKPVRGAYAERAKARVPGSNEGSVVLVHLATNDSLALKDLENEFMVYPESKSFENLSLYHWVLKRFDRDRGVAAAQRKIDSLKDSEKEKDATLVAYLLKLTDNHKQELLISKSLLDKFPVSEIAKQTRYRDFFYRDTSIYEREKLFKRYIKDFPEKDERSDALAGTLAVDFADKGMFDKYEEYRHFVKDPKYLIFALGMEADQWAERSKYLNEAKYFSGRAVALSKKLVANAISHNYLTLAQSKNFEQKRYDTHRSIYNYVIFKQGHLKKALKLQRLIWKSNQIDDLIKKHYLQMLIANREFAKAQKIAENTRPLYKWSKYVSILKQCYIGINGNANGFERYTDSLFAVKTPL